MEKCKFDVDGVCYAIECHFPIKCKCKDDDWCVVRIASMDAIRERERKVHVNELEPKITVMQPTVKNVSNIPFKNVSWKQIPLSKGLYTTVDNTDYDWLNQWSWHAVKSSKTYYATRTDYSKGTKKSIKMHRLIMNTPKGIEVDHKDHNGLNNQRNNLRNSTHAENQHNSTKLGISQYHGVSIFRNKNFVYWQARISINKNNINIGTFRSEKLAAIAYDAKAKELFGEFANLNFPETSISNVALEGLDTEQSVILPKI